VKKITGIVFIFIVCAVLSLTGCSNIGSRKNTFTFATWAAGVELQEFNEIINRVNQNADGKYKIEVLSVP
jgi:multiple sugar transport system substrate-binding protein